MKLTKQTVSTIISCLVEVGFLWQVFFVLPEFLIKNFFPGMAGSIMLSTFIWGLLIGVIFHKDLPLGAVFRGKSAEMNAELSRIFGKK